MTRRVLRRLAERVAAAYDDRPAPCRCEAYGGPCDGRRWELRGRLAPIWLLAGDGRRHLYVPLRSADAPVVRYRYAG